MLLNSKQEGNCDKIYNTLNNVNCANNDICDSDNTCETKRLNCDGSNGLVHLDISLRNRKESVTPDLDSSDHKLGSIHLRSTVTRI